jgi:hypothetical protein
MKAYKLGNVKIVECENREEALRIANGLKLYRELWMMILVAEQQGLLSAN